MRRKVLWTVAAFAGYAVAAFVGVVVILKLGGTADIVSQWLGFLGLGGIGSVVLARVNVVRGHTSELVNGRLDARVRREVGIELARQDAIEERRRWEDERRSLAQRESRRVERGGELEGRRGHR